MKKIILFCVIVFLILVDTSIAETFPKLAIYHTSQIASIHKIERGVFDDFSLVIFGYENWINNPKSMKAFREKYPDSIMLAYVNPMEVYYKTIDKRPWNKELSRKVLGLNEKEFLIFSRQIADKKIENIKKEEHKKILEKIKSSPYAKWFLWTTADKHAVFYTRLPYWMMNMASNCPKVDGLKWNQFIAQFYLKNIFFSDVRPDGIFQDNATADVFWMNGFAFKPEKDGWIDSNLDGKPDTQENLDFYWKKGQEEFVSIFRNVFGKNFLILGNKGKPEFSPGNYDGKMFEEFPFTYGGEDKRAGGWFQCMKNYFETGPYSIIQAPQTYNEKIVKFVLCSALMGDGYFAIGHNNYKQFKFYRKIGNALGPHIEHEDSKKPEKEYYWQREFEKATVKVWPYQRKGEIIYK